MLYIKYSLYLKKKNPKKQECVSETPPETVYSRFIFKVKHKKKITFDNNELIR